jgi:hypothetical protein
MSEAKQPPSGSHQIAIQAAKARLLENGGYEIVHQSPGLVPKAIPSSCRRAPSTSSSATSN